MMFPHCGLACRPTVGRIGSARLDSPSRTDLGL